MQGVSYNCKHGQVKVKQQSDKQGNHFLTWLPHEIALKSFGWDVPAMAYRAKASELQLRYMEDRPWRSLWVVQEEPPNALRETSQKAEPKLEGRPRAIERTVVWRFNIFSRVQFYTLLTYPISPGSSWGSREVQPRFSHTSCL